MSNYTHINFAEIEPTTSENGFDLRFGRKHIDSRDLGISRIHLDPGVRSPVAHRHHEQEEAHVVVGGTGRALLDGDVLGLRQGDVVRVAPETVRAFEAGADGLELIAVGGPRPESGDGEIVDAEWPE